MPKRSRSDSWECPQVQRVPRFVEQTRRCTRLGSNTLCLEKRRSRWRHTDSRESFPGQWSDTREESELMRKRRESKEEEEGGKGNTYQTNTMDCFICFDKFQFRVEVSIFNASGGIEELTIESNLSTEGDTK
jgi:hypothetical protein